MATWWVGVFTGCFLARIRFYSDSLGSARTDILKGFLTVFSFAFTLACLGALIGYIRAFHFPFNDFLGWEKELTIVELKRFAVVGYIHNSGLLGGFVGLILAIVFLKRKMRSQELELNS